MKTWFHRIFLTVALICVMAGSSFANTCLLTAVTGGNWSTAGTWTACGGVAPQPTDDASIIGLTGTLTIDGTSGGPNTARSVVFSGATTGTLAQASAKQLNVGDPAGGGAGAFTLVSGLTYSPNPGSLIKFVSGTTGNNITTAGKTMGPVTFDGVGGAWSTIDAFTGNDTLITLTNGGFTLGANIIHAGLSSSNSNTRSLNLSTFTWTLSGANNWDITTPTGMTLTAGSGTVSMAVTTTTQTFHGGGLTYGTLTNTGITTGSLTVFEANTFAALTLNQGAGATGQYKLGANQAVSGTFTFNSNSVTNRDYITSDTKGTPRTITAATVTTNGGDLQDITGAGAGSWNISGSTFGGGDCGGNSGITFNTPKTNFMVNGGVSVNFSAANWKTTTGGVTGITPAYPLPQDTNKVDTGWTGASKTLTIDASALRIGALDFTSAANTPGLVFTTAASYFGTIKLVSGMTVSGTALITLEGRGSQNITSAGLTITAPFAVNSIGGTWTQLDNITDNRAAGNVFNLISGTFASGSFNMTLSGATAQFQVTGGSYTSSGTLSLTGATGATFVISGGDVNMTNGVYSMTGAGSSATLGGGTFEIGTLTLTGRTFQLQGTAVQLGTGGAAYSSGQFLPGVGTLAPTTGNKITFIGAASITVAADSGGGSSSFTFGP